MPVKNIWCLFAFLVFSLLTSGCAVTNTFGPYKGKVVDADTKEPIEGAVVYMECKTKTGNIGGVQYHYADAKEVMTDKNGEFHIILTAVTARPGHIWEEIPSLIIFKPGYGLYPLNKKSSVDIKEKDISYIFPSNTFVTISLPKLKTIKDMRMNVALLPFPQGVVPYEKLKNLFRLRNVEYVNIGVDPYLEIPKP